MTSPSGACFGGLERFIPRPGGLLRHAFSRWQKTPRTNEVEARTKGWNPYKDGHVSVEVRTGGRAGGVAVRWLRADKGKRWQSQRSPERSPPRTRLTPPRA